jgi:phosphoglycolate phosphatase
MAGRFPVRSSAMPLPALVVFDLAGTTVADRGQVPAAFEAALAEHGVTVTPEQVGAVRGASKRQAIATLVGDGADASMRSAAIYAAFTTQLRARYATDPPRAIAGAPETFDWLRGRGVRVALGTGFDRDITAMLLAALGWAAGVVDAVVCGDDVPLGRPAPFLIYRAMEQTDVVDVRRVAAVGDTALDLQAGANAQVGWNVGVLSGAHARERLAAEPHTHIVASVADLPGLFERE